MTFEDKVVLVTGGAQGIGEGIARRFHGLGAQVAVFDMKIEAAQALAKALSESGPQVKAYACDVSDAAKVDEAVGEVMKDFSRIDVLVNNAGITRDGILMRMKDEAWQLVLDINLKGTFHLTRAVCRGMLKARSGAIVNIASVVGVFGNAGQANYSASKAGVIGLTKTAAKEFGQRGIRVNAVAPGFIQTEMTAMLDEEQKKLLVKDLPMKRMGTVEDVANAVCFLASDESSYITGQVLNICGGMIM